MRLLRTAPSPSPLPETEEFIGSQIPPYAILSHTWSAAEQTLAHLSTPDAPLPATLQPSLAKVTRTLALAHTRDALAHAWVDTVCIDKSSSAELAEAINSMFAWYAAAAVCYVFLSDLAPGSPADLERDLPRCRWFTRGWTLQELIAPREVVFFDREWRWRGDKGGWAGLLSKVTGVPETSTADLSVFAWKEDRVPCPAFAGMLAESPRQFASCGDMEMKLGDPVYANFAITTRGIQVDASLLLNQVRQDCGFWTVALNTFCHIRGTMVGVPLRKIGVGLYARSNPDTHAWLGSDAKYRLDSVGRAERMLFELKLRQFKFEGCSRAVEVVEDIFGGKLEEEVIATGLGPVNYWKDSKIGLSVRVNLRQELLPDICVNPVMILDLS
ncbi:hypothetical protein NEMBOFW57_010601 [Staphylotrichum longicolle]|uniref:Heterokaryon incompatibility domain-containing protein n=1 Tax=Staphylotrichum longicolle TaxID=669026 RepID=A0AAD4HUF0_9PEZI|nr:hypothetical protein NEMBOFW57_010601 [Staphylotrichum longicolle]